MKNGFWQKLTGAKLHSQTDDELMELIKNGDQPAFQALFDRHGGRLLGYSQRLLGDRDRAEDLSQDVWMKVIRNAQSYQAQGHFIAWLFTITRNAAFNQLRKSKDWQSIDENPGHLEDFSEDFEAALERQADLDQLKKAIDALPATQRAVIVMSLNDEMSYEDMARELGTTVSAVKSLLFRARKKLQESWEGES